MRKSYFYTALSTIAITLLSSSMSVAATTPDRIMHKAWEQDGKSYKLEIFKIAKLTEAFDMFGPNSQTLTHEDLPYYAVSVAFVGDKVGETYNTHVECLVTWPSYRTWKNINDANDKSLSDQMVSLEDFIETEGTAKTFRHVNSTDPSDYFLPNCDSEGKVQYFPIWSNHTNEFQKYNGVSGLKFSDDAAKVSEFTLESVTNNNTAYTVPFSFYFSNDTEWNGTYKDITTGVESIENVDKVKVYAQGGVITVVSPVAADLQIVSLAGSVVASTGIEAGTPLNVETGEGMFIVKVGKTNGKLVMVK